MGKTCFSSSEDLHYGLGKVQACLEEAVHVLMITKHSSHVSTADSVLLIMKGRCGKGAFRSPTRFTQTSSNLPGTSARLGPASEQFFLPKSYSTHQLSWLMYM